MRIRGKCSDCGRDLTGHKALRCQKCYAISRRKNPEIDRKQYAANWQRQKKYGMEPSDFDVYWQACRGKCFICEKDMKRPTATQGQGLDVVAVDHNHVTGNVRGLLCNACNKALGLIKDDIKILKKAITYLEYEHGKKIS